jgi:hypothetical protein
MPVAGDQTALIAALSSDFDLRRSERKRAGEVFFL